MYFPTVHLGSIPAVFVVLLISTIDGLPLMNMDDNLAQNHVGITNPSQELLASHQDLHPIRIPDDAPASDRSNTTTELPLIPAFPNQPKDMQSTPQLSVTHTQDATLVLPAAVPNVQRPNATQMDKLLNDLHIPLSNPNSTTIQQKLDGSTTMDRGSRDLLPSIVASGNKELSGNSVGSGSGVPPSAFNLPHGESPKQLIPNPFGSNPAVIAVDVPPSTPVKPVKQVIS